MEAHWSYPDGPHRPTFCAWELDAVWHEQQAWSRYLRTSRRGREALISARFVRRRDLRAGHATGGA